MKWIFVSPIIWIPAFYYQLVLHYRYHHLHRLSVFYLLNTICNLKQSSSIDLFLFAFHIPGFWSWKWVHNYSKENMSIDSVF